jgi:hypothetical protein
MDVRDTDLVSLSRDLNDRLAACLVEEGRCLVAASPHIRSLPVRLRVGHRYARNPKMSLSRIAWAFANPHDHLTADDYAIHTCQNTGKNGSKLCCRGEHLKKGTREDKEIAEAARAKGFLDR